MKTRYLIPARKGSKGFRLKNRALVPITVNQIPENQKSDIFVSTDDEHIIEYCHKYNLHVRTRPEHLANDVASLKDVIIDSIEYFNFDAEDNVVVLFPTFPQRTFSNIQETLEFFKKNNLKSCTGKVPIRKNHPYLCFEKIDDIFGKKIIDHQFYRRQDYPQCFGLCHLVCMMKASEAYNIDDLLVNGNTGYHWCEEDLIDVDYENDFINYSHEMTTGIERFNPRGFEIDFVPFARHFERYFRSLELLGKTGFNETWLDCACGSGYGTSFLTNFATHVVGYDIDENAVAYAKTFYKNSFCEFISNNSELISKKFDVIFSIETIEHMPLKDAATFLRKCCQLLKDGGNLVITTPIVEKTNHNPSNEFHFFECSLEDFRILLYENGFVILDELLKETTFTDGETKDQGYFRCQKLK